MGLSTQTISQAAQTAVNQGLVRSFAVANASLVAQQTITNGTTDLIKAAAAENSTVTLTETRVKFHENPLIVQTGPFSAGQLAVTPPKEGDTPQVTKVLTPAVNGLPDSENPTRLEPTTRFSSPEVGGDLVVPGGMVRLQDAQLGAVTVETAPRPPEFTAPVLSTSASDNPSQPGIDTASQHYVQVVLVGSAQSVVGSAAPSEPPAGP